MKRELYKRVYDHLKEKYGEGGYAKFYLEKSREIIMKPLFRSPRYIKK